MGPPSPSALGRDDGAQLPRKSICPGVLPPPTPSETCPPSQNCTPPLASGAETHSGACRVLGCGFHTLRVRHVK